MGRDYSIQSLQRGMQVLDAFLEARRPLHLEEICTLTGLPKSTAFRIVINLLQGQYLVEMDEGYWLGLKLLRLGALVQEKLDLKQQARPFLEKLRDRVNETVHLGVFDADLRVVYVDKLASLQAIGVMMSQVGLTAPMHCTGLGKAMAAFRPEEEIRRWIAAHGLQPVTRHTITGESAFLEELGRIRRQGYAVDNGELEEGVRCVAAPIRNDAGQVIAAVSVSVPESRWSSPPDPTLVQAVLTTARQISEAMGWENSGQ